MVQLQPGFNAIQWTSATTAISSTAFAGLVVIVYTPNPVTGQGFFTYEPGDNSPNMNIFAKGFDYLVKVTGAYLLADGVAGDESLFASVPGFTPTLPNTSPSIPVGRTETGVAAEAIVVGRLVAQTTAGLRHYSSAVPEHERLLYGIATNSALQGGSVTVRRPGFVDIAGWGLPVGAVLLAGVDGRLVTEVPASSFCQIVGRSLSADSMLYQPESITFLSNPQKTR